VQKQGEELAIAQPNKATSAGAAFTRSLLLFIGASEEGRKVTI
jgi:hypothetical protein